MYCQKCGAENVESAKFCKNCGEEKISINAKQVDFNQIKPNKTLGIIFAVASIFAGLLLGGILGILLGVVATSWCLKHYGVVAENSIWVSESEIVNKIAYMLLAIIVIGICVFAYFTFY